MKVIGSDSNDRSVIVRLTQEEWTMLQLACGTPYEKRSSIAGASVDVKIVDDAVSALREMKSMRKDMGAVQKRWDALASQVDAVLEK